MIVVLEFRISLDIFVRYLSLFLQTDYLVWLNYDGLYVKLKTSQWRLRVK